MSEAPRTGTGRRLLAFLPLIVFAGLAIIFLLSLFTGDPSKLPSALINKRVPEFALPALPAATPGGAALPGFTSADLARGRLTLVNVFASWCAPCHQEHPFLMELAKDPRLMIFGINYKDEPENARRFLGRLGNPFAAIGIDRDGRTAIDWGVYGVPETFLVRGDGIIAFKYVGPLTEAVIRDKLEPAIRAALP